MTGEQIGIQGGIHTPEKRVGNERKIAGLELNNNSSKNDVQVGTTENETIDNRSEIVPEEDSRSKKRKAKQTSNKAGSQLKCHTIEAMKDLFNKTPDEIVNWLTSAHLFEKKQKVKDEAVTLLVKLLAKACDCESIPV
ncbi:hypothetical protein OS493_011859 [Desmophyllum pertusum]|uniref:Uncharacterized protein n=1 Tax=Desmophyllum pertusum TaxID=174260 RepID=A0A9X0CFU1_9CNID|nr:hypothetical protein OS493_011859 [Desmophyllum pertusum]